MTILFLFLTATTTNEIPFSLVIGIAGGLGGLGTIFGYFFTLKERMSKLEIKVAEQEKQITALTAQNGVVVEKLTHIEKSLTKIETSLQFYKEAQQR